MKIYLDSSVEEEMKSMGSRVDGFTTNPTLMKKAGVENYQTFAEKAIKISSGKPISFEVFGDSLEDIDSQARIMSLWGDNVYVKIPITLTNGESTVPLIGMLQKEGIKVNITAVCDINQLPQLKSLNPNVKTIVSIFAGRIADTGVDSRVVIQCAKKLVFSGYEVLWASPREVLNIYQAEKSGADIITCTSELLKKYDKFKGMDLNDLSLLTVRQFFEDGRLSGLKI
jgi:transaldolase